MGSQVNLLDFCCDEIIFHIQKLEQIIIYLSENRSFLIKVNQHIGQEIQYCPWCGTKLPKELSNEWWDILEKEYNIIYPLESERDKVPAEFWTDEWWKKRGL